jgi:hypothetical protein
MASTEKKVIPLWFGFDVNARRMKLLLCPELEPRDGSGLMRVGGCLSLRFGIPSGSFVTNFRKRRQDNNLVGE